jgi:hypothetical protein
MKTIFQYWIISTGNPCMHNKDYEIGVECCEGLVSFTVSHTGSEQVGHCRSGYSRYKTRYTYIYYINVQ